MAPSWAAVALLFAAVLTTDSRGGEPGGALIWKLDDLARIGGQSPVKLGQPVLVADRGARSICFDGAKDGFVVPLNPIAGWAAFTIQARIKPDPSGPAEQRFLHLQDARGVARALMEIRLNPKGEWWLDTFVFSESGRLALIDPEQRHPAGNWHWVAVTYEHGKLAHFVDGRREKEGMVEFPPMEAGETSIGVRLNRVHWFKGCLQEIRFDPGVVPAESLQR